MLGVLITIIIIIGIIYLMIAFYQHLLLRKVRLVEEKNKNVQGKSLEQAINKTAKLDLAGESLDQFKSYQRRYHKIHSQSFDFVDHLIQDIEGDSRGLNFVKTRQEYQKAKTAVNGISVDIKDINDGLIQLNQMTKQHQKAIVDLNRRFRKIHKNLLTKNYIYGPSIDRIESYLGKVKKQFNRFANLAKIGDHDRADEILKKLTSQTDQLEVYIKMVPELYKDLSSTYPKQIGEIKRGYRYMLRDGYKFPEKDLGSAIEYVQKRVNKAVKILQKLSLTQVRSDCHQIESMINQLYDFMQREIDAKHQVNKDSYIVTEYIEHAQAQNYALKVELKKLSKNYNLNHYEIQTALRLSKTLDRIAGVHHRDLDAIANNDVIYSRALSHQKRAESRLGQIEAQQRQINKSVYNLNQEEDRARSLVDKFNFIFHRIDREISQINLPGLPKAYRDYYNLVFQENKQLSDKVSQVKISMDEVNKYLKTIKHDMKNLQSKTRRLIDNASVAEQLMQYSNRYRSSYHNVAQASAKAKRLFEDEYQYRSSLKTISAALERVEPGASQRIEKEYHQNKAKSSAD